VARSQRQARRQEASEPGCGRGGSAGGRGGLGYGGGFGRVLMRGVSGPLGRYSCQKNMRYSMNAPTSTNTPMPMPGLSVQRKL
jgi:hypothetical protein